MKRILAFFDAAMNTQSERIIAAQKYLARCISEREYHLEMSTFYINRVGGINPRESAKDAFRFAEALLSYEEHQADFQLWNDRVAEARAKLKARMDGDQTQIQGP